MNRDSRWSKQGACSARATQVWLAVNHNTSVTGPRSAVGSVSGYRCVSDCRSRGREFDPGSVPYFHGD